MLGGIACSLRLNHLHVELLRVFQRLERILVALGRTIARGLRLLNLSLRRRHVFGPTARAQERQVRIGHTHGGSGLIALGLEQRGVEPQQLLTRLDFLPFIDEKRLHAARNLAGNQHIFGFNRARAAQLLRASDAAAIPPVVATAQDERQHNNRHNNARSIMIHMFLRQLTTDKGSIMLKYCRRPTTNCSRWISIEPLTEASRREYNQHCAKNR